MVTTPPIAPRRSRPHVTDQLARALGVDRLLIRLAFVVIALGTWLAIPAYAGLWAILSTTDLPTRPPAAAGVDRVRRAIGLALSALGLLLLGRTHGAGFLPPQILWPLVAVVAGVGLVVWQTGIDVSLDTIGRGRLGIVRVLGGLAITAIGTVALLAANLEATALRDGLLAGGLLVGGLALLLGPWIYLLARDRATQRQARVRADERAAVAAHLHDSVLQTLALIQRSDDHGAATALARRQERELRQWLYGGGRPPRGTADLRRAIEEAAAEVEDLHGTPIDVVIVGDHVVDAQGDALRGAVREAMVNAARWSDAGSVDVFVEMTETDLEGFVRDTGRGFDPDTVGLDHRGVADSIIGRAERHGGTAEVRSSPGAGTEVIVRIPVQP
jgi:signal transduction histidine kinase